MSLRTKAFLVFILAITLFQAGLGFWQWQRMGEKQAFLAAIEQGAKAAPKPLSEAKLWDRVTIEGRYLHDKTAYLRTSRPEVKPGERDALGRVPASGFGVAVMTPFVTRLCGADGKCALTTVYVHRGFVPTPPDGRIPAFDRPEEPVTITGFMRPSERPSLFQPGNTPARGIWFHRTIEEMAKVAGLFNAEAQPSPYDRFIDREAAAGENAPPHGILIADFIRAVPNNHFQYALTWWALALTNMLVMAAYLLSRRKRDGA